MRWPGYRWTVGFHALRSTWFQDWSWAAMPAPGLRTRFFWDRAVGGRRASGDAPELPWKGLDVPCLARVLRSTRESALPSRHVRQALCVYRRCADRTTSNMVCTEQQCSKPGGEAWRRSTCSAGRVGSVAATRPIVVRVPARLRRCAGLTATENSHAIPTRLKRVTGGSGAGPTIARVHTCSRSFPRV